MNSNELMEEYFPIFSVGNADGDNKIYVSETDANLQMLMIVLYSDMEKLENKRGHSDNAIIGVIKETNQKYIAVVGKMAKKQIVLPKEAFLNSLPNSLMKACIRSEYFKDLKLALQFGTTPPKGTDEKYKRAFD